MFSIAILVAAGPCLIAIMAAFALFVVHRSLSRVPHALIWSAAFAATALRWAVFAFRNRIDDGDLRGGIAYDLLGLLSIMLLAEGFRRRAGSVRTRWIAPAIGVIAVPLEIAIYASPAAALRAALVPLLAGGMLIWAATTVVLRERRSSIAELVVIGMMALLAAIELSAAALAIAEQIGIVRSRTLYIALYSLTVEPVGAALGMVTLLLIAFDFSAEQRRLIHTDPLTGVLNRLGLEEAARSAMERPRRARPLAIALTDIDAFKAVNDRYGHAAGDEALIGFARHLACAIDRDGIVGRLGGEEFAVLLPGNDGAGALARIEPIRAELAGLAIEGLPDLSVTASFGVAEHRPGESFEQLIERADAALYRSKRAGRDRSTLAPA